MRYAWLTIKHKWFVFVAGISLGVPLWRLMLHDWTKFLPWNLVAYNRQFFGKADRPEQFVRAWLRHQNAHDHHWEWWIPRTGHNRCQPPYPDTEPLPMSVAAVREMVADWMGASRAYEGRWPTAANWPWLRSHLCLILPHLSRHTGRQLIEVLAGQGFWPQPCDYLSGPDRCSRPENPTERCGLGVCPFGHGKLWMCNDATEGDAAGRDGERKP